MKELAGRPQDGIDIEYHSAMPRSDNQATDWSVATWEGAEREQLRRWAELSLEEILRAQ